MEKVKTGIVVIAAITLSVLLPACGSNNSENKQGMVEDHNSEKLQKDISPMMASYIDIKNALISDDPEKAGTAARQMMDKVEKEDLKNTLKTISGSDDLKEQRMAFSDLSNQMYDMAISGQMKGTMYWNHCPMAMDGQGANWLSMNEKINNPYMGQKMPGCGSVLETLNK